MIKALEEAASPIASFVNDWCVVGPNYSIVMKDLYRAWQAYCKEQGDLKPGPFNHFGAALGEVIPSLHRKGRHPNRCYVGVALSEQGDEAFDEAIQQERVLRRL
jgi:phage/plasmid-associated DNA primase